MGTIKKQFVNKKQSFIDVYTTCLFHIPESVSPSQIKI